MTIVHIGIGSSITLKNITYRIPDKTTDIPKTTAQTAGSPSQVIPPTPFAALLSSEMSDALGVGTSELKVIIVVPEIGVVGIWIWPEDCELESGGMGSIKPVAVGSGLTSPEPVGDDPDSAVNDVS